MNTKTFQVTDLFSQVLLVMSVFCLLLVVLSYFRGKNSRTLLKEAVAKVSEIRSETIQAKDEKGELREQGPFRIVYVEFNTSTGMKTTARLKYVLSSGAPNYPIGSTIPIQYSPEFPDQIWEVGFLDKHGLELAFGIFGVGFLLCSLLIAWLSKGMLPPVSGSPTQVYIARGFVFFGLVILGLSMRSFYLQGNLSGEEDSTATVTGYESVKSNRARYETDDIYPVLRFITSKGPTMTVRSQSLIDHAHDSEGAHLRVTYSTRDPALVRPATADRPIAGVVFLIFVGLFALSFGGIWMSQLFRG